MVPVARLARWAAASMPRASPETTAKPAKLTRQPLGEFHPGRRRIARTDDGDHGVGEGGAVAAHRDQRRRVVDHLQPQRVIVFAEPHQLDPERARRLGFALRLSARMDSRRTGGAAAAGEIGHRRKRRTGAAIMVDERAESARARGPTFSLRMRRSQSSRCSSVSCTPWSPPCCAHAASAVWPPQHCPGITSRQGRRGGCASLSAGLSRLLGADLALRAGKEPRNVGAVHEP